MKKLKTIFVLLIVAFVAIQFFGPERSNPPVIETRTVQAKTNISPEVMSILQRACFDCHSNETVWPWYAKVAPVSWLVANDVNHGRSHNNFSDWGQYSPKKLKKIYVKLCEEIEDRNMPLPIYLKMHPEAELTASEIEAICSWTDEELDLLEGRGKEETTEDHDEHEHK